MHSSEHPSPSRSAANHQQPPLLEKLMQEAPRLYPLPDFTVETTRPSIDLLYDA
jgi:hypothetical protein